MGNFATSMLRTLAQLLIGWAVSAAAAWGLDIPQQVRDWALTAIVAAGMFAYTGLVRYAETRTGPGWWAVLCRRVARLLMLGITAKPAYESSTSGQAGGGTSSARFRPGVAGVGRRGDGARMQAVLLDVLRSSIRRGGSGSSVRQVGTP